MSQIKNITLDNKIKFFRDHLPDSEFFDQDDNISKFCELIDVLSFEENDQVIAEGDVPECVYFIYNGSVSISSDGKEMDKMNSGFFGEMALLNNDLRTATVTSDSDLILLALNKENFNKLVSVNPGFKESIEQTVLERENWNMMVKSGMIETGDIADPSANVKNENLSDPVDELTEQLKRVQADFENYRKRQTEDFKNMQSNAKKQVLADMVPVLTNLWRMTTSVPEDIQDNNWVTGVKAIEKQMENTLFGLGLSKIDTEGEKFDPMMHEVVSGEGDIVSDEIEPGYMLAGIVLQVAKVKLSK